MSGDADQCSIDAPENATCIAPDARSKPPHDRVTMECICFPQNDPIEGYCDRQKDRETTTVIFFI